MRTQALFWLVLMSPVRAEDGWNQLTPAGDPGLCSVQTWRSNWPGCEFEDGVSEGHLFLWRQDFETSWRVLCAPGQIGPERGGVGWRWPVPEGSRPAGELQYTVLFEPGFEFAKGGKLPGLCGGPKTITGGDRCTGYDGWSARLMWRRDGRGQAYLYHPRMKSKYGDELDFPPEFRFPGGQPVGVRIEVVMNSPGKLDGVLRVWTALPGAAEQLMVERTDLEWTKESRIGVDSLLFNVFHGGNDASWAPAAPCAVQFSRLAYRWR